MHEDIREKGIGWAPQLDIQQQRLRPPLPPELKPLSRVVHAGLPPACIHESSSSAKDGTSGPLKVRPSENRVFFKNVSLLWKWATDFFLFFFDFLSSDFFIFLLRFFPAVLTPADL